MPLAIVLSPMVADARGAVVNLVIRVFSVYFCCTTSCFTDPDEMQFCSRSLFFLDRRFFLQSFTFATFLIDGRVLRIERFAAITGVIAAHAALFSAFAWPVMGLP